MENIVLISENTKNLIEKVLLQYLNYLSKDAKYAHPNSNLKVLDSNVRITLSSLRSDIIKFSNNIEILGKIKELNDEKINT